ncbi:flagellar biosynthesis anti-sigma factor FlgM [Providencia huaxiensis]
MAIEQTPAISALTQVTNRDPQDTATPMRDKKISTNEIIKESTFVPSELQKNYYSPKLAILTALKLNKLNKLSKMAP